MFYKICTHIGYTISKAIFFALYLVAASLYYSNMPAQTYTLVNLIVHNYLFIMMVEFLFELIAFGFKLNNKKELIYEGVAWIYVFCYIGATRGV